MHAFHSGCERTKEVYRNYFNKFMKFLEASAQDEYDSINEKTFKRKYAMLLKTWIAELHNARARLIEANLLTQPLQSVRAWR